MTVSFKKIKNICLKAFVSLGGAGFAPKASGTLGSLMTLPFIWWVHEEWDQGFYVSIFVVSFILSILAIWALKLPKERVDASWIVIDEWCGQWLAALFAFSLWELGAAFLLFRLFDIWKPPGVRYFDQMKSPFGVVADDVVAGFYALLVLTGFQILGS